MLFYGKESFALNIIYLMLLGESMTGANNGRAYNSNNNRGG